jgi:hypothetical protein
MLLLSVTLIAAARAEEPGFWEQLTPAERRAAGLDRLTPEQRAALDRLAERFLHPGAADIGAVIEQSRQQIREEARQEVRAQVRAEVKQEVRAEVKQELQAEEKAKAATRAGLPAGEEGPAVIRTRILGQFHGWSGATTFRLQNGQVWVQSNSDDSYWVPTMENPEVELRPSKLGGWKLYLTAKGTWVRVHRVQ